MHRIVLRLYIETLVFQSLENGVTRIESLLPVELATIFDFAVVCEYGDEFQMMPLADFKIVGVVSWCDLDGSGSEFWVNVVVGDDTNDSARDKGVNGLI